MLFVGVEKFRPPEFAIAKKVLLAGLAAGEGEPLDIVGFADVIERWIIKRRMRGCGRDNRGQMRRQLFRGRPLIETGIRTAPHRDFPVAKRLLRQPFDHVVTVARLVGKRLKLTPGIAAATNIDKRKYVTVRREISRARVIRVRDVGREGEHNRCFRRSAVRGFWKIKRRV